MSVSKCVFTYNLQLTNVHCSGAEPRVYLGIPFTCATVNLD